MQFDVTAQTDAPSGVVPVDGGTFRMGSDRHYPEEAPVHQVTISPFWIDRAQIDTTTANGRLAFGIFAAFADDAKSVIMRSPRLDLERTAV